MFCTSCGAAVPPGNRFCGNCGQTIAGPASPPPCPAPTPHAPAFPARVPGNGPVPPDLAVGVLLLLINCFCGGIMILIWSFYQASFVKKLDPRSNATLWLAAGIGMPILSVIAFIVAVMGLSAMQSGWAAIRNRPPS